MRANRQRLIAILLLSLAVGLAGCSNRSVVCETQQKPAIPPLPAEALQPARSQECLPDCSTNLSGAFNDWRQKLSNTVLPE